MEKNIDILSNLITNNKLSLKNVVDLSNKETNENKLLKNTENDFDQGTNIKRSNENKYKTTKFLNFNTDLLKRKSKMNTMTLKLVNPVEISDLTENNKNQELLDNITRNREKEYMARTKTLKTNLNNDTIKEILDENIEDKEDYEENDFDSIKTDENVEKIYLKNREINIRKNTLNKIGLVIRNTKKQLTKKLQSANLENNKKIIDDVISIKLTSNLSNTYKISSDKFKNIFDTDILNNNNINCLDEPKENIDSKSSFFNFSPDKKRKNTTKSIYDNNDYDDEFLDNESINNNQLMKEENAKTNILIDNNFSEFNSIKDSVGNANNYSDKNNVQIDTNTNLNLNDLNEDTFDKLKDNSNRIEENKQLMTHRKTSSLTPKSNRSQKSKHSIISSKSTKKASIEKEIDDFEFLNNLDKEAESLILENLLQQYYYDIKFNIPGNYEEYVVNGITIISVLEKLLIKNNIKSPELSNDQKEDLKKFDLAKKTLFIDLDETLIHSDINNEFDCAETVISINVNNESSSFGLIVRPYVSEFLQFASERFNLVIFTAGVKDYADPIIDYLDPDNTYFALRLYRDSCTQYENFFIKDLTILNIPIEQCVLLDNCIYSFAKDVQSGILISTFHNNMEDKDLLNVADYLDDNILQSENVRLTNESFFGFESIKKMMYNKLIEEGGISIK